MGEHPSKSIEQIFLDVVDLPREARAQVLAERCGGDERLRLHVQRLIDADEENTTGDAALSGLALHVTADPVPSRVGNYVVRGVAGEGGMGAVYDAVHEPTGRRAAVKLIRAGVATARGRERLRIEAESLARLNDPGIAQLYDAGLAEVTWPDGGAGSRRPFIAMEFVEGAVSITRFARDSGLSVRQRLALVERVARAVHHAHQRGVIHRDLKPGNVLVNPANGTPKVVDFGIARMIDATTAGVTLTGQVVGTTGYMSPEQASGDPTQVDARSDIYSLGAILYELLARRPLIDPGSASNFAALLRLLESATPPQPGAIDPQLEGDVEAIVHKAIARVPDDRYGSAQALADDLSRYLDGREITARAPTTLERFVRVVKRNKLKVAAAVMIVASLLAAVVGTSWGMLRARRASRAEADQRRMADLSAAKARSAEADSRAFGQFLTSRILATARPKDMQGGLGLDVSVVEAIKQAEQQVEHDFAGRPGAEALARHAIGITWRQRGELAAAEQQFRRAIELAQRAYGPDHEETVNMRNSLQVLLQQMQRNTDALSEQEKIVKDLESTVGPRDVRTVTARYNLAIYRAKAGDYAAALPLLEKVHADRVSSLGGDNVVTLSTVNDIAEVHQLMGHNEKALSLQHDLIAKFSSKLGEDNPQTLNARYRLACLHQLMGNFEAAEEVHERALPGLRRTLGNQNVTTLDCMFQLAKCRLALKDALGAVPLYLEYAEGQGKLWGEQSPQTARMLAIITTSLLREGEFEAAEGFARRQVSIQEKLAAGKPPLFAAQCLLGECLEGLQRFREAEPLLKAGLDGLDRQQSQQELAPELKAARQRARDALARCSNHP